jgi:ornithine cyclodeaminase
MIVLSAADVAALLPMDEAIAVVEAAMRRVSAGGAQLPLRFAVPVGGANMMGVMAGALDAPHVHGVKLVSLYPGNPARGLSSHRGAVVLFEAETGGAVAMMDAGLLTAIRTAAASAVATRALARPEAATLTLVGYGEQAEHHLTAIRAVRPVARVIVTGRDQGRAGAFAEAARARHPGLAVEATGDIAGAVAAADIVCTVTAAATPVVMGAWLHPGQHLNIVGASVASKREVDDAVVDRAAIWVDYRPSALAQAGEIIAAIEDGRRSAADLPEIGETLTGRAPGRAAPNQITAYRSLGIAAQDLAAAAHVFGRAEAEGRGQRVTL